LSGIFLAVVVYWACNISSDDWEKINNSCIYHSLPVSG